jgi:CheY-like chemotaxis protein
MQANVLVVDDEPAWREILQLALEDAGHRVQLAGTFQEAEEALQEEVFHVAVIDIRLESGGTNGATGMDLLDRIVEAETELPYCIVVTGFPSVPDTRDSFKKYRAWDFVSKLTFDEAAFLQSVGEAVEWALQRDVRHGLNARWQEFRATVAAARPEAGLASTTALVAFLAEALGLPPPALPAERHGPFVVIRLDATEVFRHTGIPQPMLLLALQKERVDEGDLEGLRQVVDQVAVRPTQVILLLADEAQVAGALPLIQRAGQAHGYDVIPLFPEQLGRVLLARAPADRFRQLVCSQVNLNAVSPFVIAGPTPPATFFGRERELREVCQHARTVSYALIGGRRIGKTSILKQLERDRLPGAGFRALYHDCAFTPSEAELVQALATEKAWFAAPPAPLPATLAETIQALPDDRPLIILLDEVDRLVAGERASGYRIFSTLRAFHSTGRCRFVLSGEQALRAELTNADSPLYNFATEMLIGRLDFAAVEELVTRPLHHLEVDLVDEPALVRSIWEFTAGHPNVVQRLCQRLLGRLYQRQDRRLSPRDVEAVITDPDFLRRDFLNICWERATALERLASLVMAADPGLRRLTAVRRALAALGLELTLGQVDSALERLVDLRNILCRTQVGYEFAIAGFPRVLGVAARLDDLIALNSETFQRAGDAVPGTE